MANAIGSTIWKLAAEVVLNLENENFETDTQAQRIDIMEEVVCYLVHLCDRWVYPQADQQQRAEFISALVRDMARMLEDSRVDVQGDGEYQSAFFEKVNQRSGDYAGYSFDEEEGGIAYRPRWASVTSAGSLITWSAGRRRKSKHP
jgi:hypothetical protein